MKRWLVGWVMALGGMLLPAVSFAEVEAVQHVVGDAKEATPPAFVPRFDSVVRLGETSGFQADRDGTLFVPGLTVQNRFRVGWALIPGLSGTFSNSKWIMSTSG